MARGVTTDGAAIRNAREKKLLDQHTLATRCDLTVNTIRKAEQGGPITRANLREIAEKLGVPPERFQFAPSEPDNREGVLTRPDLRAKLNGVWKGTFTMPLGPHGMPYEGTFETHFDPCPTEIRGRYTLTYTDSVTGRVSEYGCVFSGDFFFGRYFRFHASSSDPGKVLFHSFYLKLNPAGSEMSGQFVGYDEQSDAIRSGQLIACGPYPSNPTS